MKRMFYLVILCLGLAGCSNSSIKSVEVIMDEGLKSATGDSVRYVLMNIITMRDDYGDITKDINGYIKEHAQELANKSEIKKYDSVTSAISSSDGIYIGEYNFKISDEKYGVAEYEFNFDDEIKQDVLYGLVEY